MEQRELLLHEEQEKHVQKKWHEMTEQEQEDYQALKQKTADAYDNIAGNLNERYRDPARTIARKHNPNKFGKNIFKRLNTKR